MKAFKQDILSAEPERLYRAWMAEFKNPFFRSYLVNQPELIQLILKERPDDFPKSYRVGEGAGFAMIEGVLLLANVLKSYRVSTEGCDTPVPVAHLTVRAQLWIYLKFDKR